MKNINDYVQKTTDMPERIIMFGEGNFLRGFVGWMVNSMIEKGVFNGRIVAVQPIANGMADIINAQNGAYTVVSRGVMNGKTINDHQLVHPISRCINPYASYDEYIKCAENPDLRFMISNTTEAGIAYEAGVSFEEKPPKTFPAKVAAFLYHRFVAFKGASDKGLVMIPCELIDRNGDNLRKCVMQYATEWNLGDDFIKWLDSSCDFLNSLVDRIVTGYPREEAASICEMIGYKDDLIDVVEPFLFWVIEGDAKYGKELPFDKAGHDVIWTKDMTPYRTRKVRILNGAHTMMVLAAYLAGFDIVLDCMNDSRFKNYLNRGLNEEIIPTLDLPRKELESYSDSVLERFANPFIKHLLLSISLNSVSKYKARVLPSLLQYVQIKNSLPPVLTFSLAALISFYRGTEIVDGALNGSRNGISYRIMDDKEKLEEFARMWKEFESSANISEASSKIARDVLSKITWWGEDLTKVSGLESAVAEWICLTAEKGISVSIDKLLETK